MALFLQCQPNTFSQSQYFLMSTPSKHSGKDTGAAKARLVAMEESWAWLQAQQEREEREMEAVILAEVERVTEERLAEAERQAEAEHCQRAEEAERQWVLEECHQQVEVEQRGSSVEIVAGPSKKRKIQEMVSDKLSEEKSTNTTNREKWSKQGVSIICPASNAGLPGKYASRRPEGLPAGSATSGRWGAAWQRRARKESGSRL